MQRKYNSIIENKIYIFANLSMGRKAIKNKLIFDVKITKLNELDINKEFINFKQRFLWIFQNTLLLEGRPQPIT
jgi:hypothetical protein